MKVSSLLPFLSYNFFFFSIHSNLLFLNGGWIDLRIKPLKHYEPILMFPSTILPEEVEEQVDEGDSLVDSYIFNSFVCSLSFPSLPLSLEVVDDLY